MPARRLLALPAATIVIAVSQGVAQAQIEIVPSQTPELNTGGWIFGMAWLVGILAFVIVLLIIVAYMRFAPRFAKDEESAKVVRADRIVPGKEAPRRNVDLSQAVPLVVQPPAVPAALAAAVAPAATAAAPAPAPTAPAPAAEPATPEAAEPATPEAAEPATPEAAEPATPAAPPAPAAAPAAPAERPEVSLDQEVYEKTLEELLSQGTDRRIAEGKAKRTAMIAARKKASGEG